MSSRDSIARSILFVQREAAKARQIGAGAAKDISAFTSYCHYTIIRAVPRLFLCAGLPFLFVHHDITRHPNYRYFSDYDKRNEFDIERFLSTKLKPKPDEIYDVVEVQVEGEKETG